MVVKVGVYKSLANLNGCLHIFIYLLDIFLDDQRHDWIRISISTTKEYARTDNVVSVKAYILALALQKQICWFQKLNVHSVSLFFYRVLRNLNFAGELPSYLRINTTNLTLL